MLKTYDPYSQFHGKIDLGMISPRLNTLFPTEEKSGNVRITRPFVRRKNLKYFNLEEGQYKERVQQLRGYKTIMELSCRSPYCPIPFVLDTYAGYCQFGCLYCFTAYSVSSLMTSFFDSDKPLLAPRYAKPTFIKNFLDNVLSARGVEPYSRDHKYEDDFCGAISDETVLKKASAQRVPLRFGTRNEPFMPMEKTTGASLMALQVIADHHYPLIINTKSDLILQDPYYKVISEMGKDVAIQVTITHNDDSVAKRLEPAAPSSTKRWNVLKIFNNSGINAMVRMEPCAAFINADDDHLQAYFKSAEESSVKNFMGDAWHHTVAAEEIKLLMINAGFDFERMWNATSEYQIVGSYCMEKAMYYAKALGLRAGTFNFHSLPWNDDPVCCMVGDQFHSWNRYSMVNFIKNELIRTRHTSFEDLDDKYYGYELHPSIRTRIKNVWNLHQDSVWRPDWVEGCYPYTDDHDNIEWRFDPSRMGEAYSNLISTFGGR